MAGKKPKRRKAAPRNKKKTEFDRVVKGVFDSLHGGDIKPDDPESKFPL